MEDKKKLFVGPMLLTFGDDGDGDGFDFGDPGDDDDTGGKTGQHGE